MTSNLLQDVLRHTAQGHIDANSHDKDDSDDELVNVVRSILLSGLPSIAYPHTPSSHSQEHLHALVRLHVPRHLLAALLHAFLVAIYPQHLPNNLVILSGHFPPRYPSGYTVYSVSAISLGARACLGNGVKVRP